MKKLPYIEDYIDLMSSHVLTWPPRDPIIKLARYDEPIVSSMSEQITRGLGFTDRQSHLAHKIVTKYKKQWATAGFDVEHQMHLPAYRLPIRQVDRRKVIDIEDGVITLRFPYDQDLISRIRAKVAEIPGELSWKPTKHAWQASLIEQRLIWAKEFGLETNFEFGDTFNKVFDSLMTQTDFNIELTCQNGSYTIINAEQSLLDYIIEHWSFDQHNLVNLVDNSSVLSYTVAQDIVNGIKHQHPELVVDLLLNRLVNITFESQIENFADIVTYANLTNRFPIYVYESGSRRLLDQVKKYFADEDIIDQGHHLLPADELATKKVLYYSHWKNIVRKMPLLVTMHTLVIGQRRQMVADLADKIVYYTQLSEPQQC